MDDLESNGELKFNVNGEEVVLTKDDLLIDMTQTEAMYQKAIMALQSYWIRI